MEVKTLETSIIKGTIEHLEDCKEALINSEFGNVFFPSESRAESFLAEGLTKGEIFVALDENGKCVGYIWFNLRGAFSEFPYIRSLAVKKECRGRGIGKGLLSFFENVAFEYSPKLLLLVDNFNLQAKKLYHEVGYKEVGVINNLFREGTSEYIMMKSKKRGGS